MKKYLVGVDGGATNCRVALIDSTTRERVAEARGGPSNIANDYVMARQNILDTITAALNKVDLGHEAFSELYAVMGIAGNNLGNFGERLQNDLPFAKAIVLNDGAVTLAGALGNEYGAMAVLGTGSVFVSRDEHGFKSVGGWGFFMGDEGSGGKLGYHLFERTIYAEDGLYPHSNITRELLAEFEGRLGFMVEKAKTMMPHEFGAYAPRVIDAAKIGDINAEKIMDEATHWIEAQVDAVGFSPDKPFCMLGGLGPIFLPRVAPRFQNAHVKAKGNALDGACTLAIENFC